MRHGLAGHVRTGEERLLRWCHDDTAYFGSVDGRLDHPLKLRVFNELTSVLEARTPPWRERHRVWIDAGPTIENTRTRQLARQLEEHGLDAPHDVRLS